MLLVQKMMKMLKHSQEQLSLNGEQPPIIGGTKAQKKVPKAPTPGAVCWCVGGVAPFSLFPFISPFCLTRVFTSVYIVVCANSFESY